MPMACSCGCSSQTLSGDYGAKFWIPDCGNRLSENVILERSEGSHRSKIVPYITGLFDKLRVTSIIIWTFSDSLSGMTLPESGLPVNCNMVPSATWNHAALDSRQKLFLATARIGNDNKKTRSFFAPA